MVQEEDKLAKDKHVDKISMPVVRPALEHVLNEVVNYIDKRKDYVPRILEVGCGIRSAIGTKLRDSERSILLHGLDIDDYALKNKDVDEVFVASCEDMPFDDNTYNIVIAQYLLEHVQDHQATLKEMARVVTTDGLMVLTFPNPASPEAVVTRLTPHAVHRFFKKYIQKVRKDKHTFPTTFSFRTVKNVVDSLKFNGFKEIKTVYFAETYYRFRYWRILGRLAVLYTRFLSALCLDKMKSSTVVIAYK